MEVRGGFIKCAPDPPSMHSSLHKISFSSHFNSMKRIGQQPCAAQEEKGSGHVFMMGASRRQIGQDISLVPVDPTLHGSFGVGGGERVFSRTVCRDVETHGV